MAPKSYVNEAEGGVSFSLSAKLPVSKHQSANQFLIRPIIAFYTFAAVNVLAALYAPIQDCDEVFNYWEPTHYLNRGYGLQTWEYSPEFAIRSWLYIVIHAIVGKFGSVFSSTKSFEFYFVRTVLALTCAFCESRLFSTISRTLNPRIGVIFMLVMVSSPGIFHASSAYLPSSFAMYTTMLGTTSFMDWRGGSKTNSGIMWFGIGGIIGWPFASALVLPFLAEELLLASITREGYEVARRLLDGTVRCMIVVVLQLAIDAFFYHKAVLVPWQLIYYNIFSGPGRGPEIFGTEPWDYYFRNLLLNFNIWFVLAMAAGPLLLLQYVSRAKNTTKFTLLRSAFFVTPFYMWLALFSIQPHKEERFLYPIYPFIGINAAIGLHIILAYIGSSDPGSLVGKVPVRLKLALVGLAVILALDVGVLRIAGIVSAYQAPLQIYSVLHQPGLARPGETVCLGKEWHRFPSSYFLPNGMRAKFIKSSFDGLLPGEFNEARIGFGFFPGTWLVPPGMNDQNIADPTKLTDIAHCSFLVDSSFSGLAGSELEPKYSLDEKTWEILQCRPFLDATTTSSLARIFWVPDVAWIPEPYRRHWGSYCLLRRRRH